MPVSLTVRRTVLPRFVSQVSAGAWLDLVLIGGLVGAALAVRWPHLLLSPQFPSISATVLLALDVSEGHALPLADQAPYLGPLFVYMLAAVYRLAGPSVEATMALPWAIGGLTVIPTYLLGRQIAGRFAGLVAGALLVTSSAHTVITSHVPLSHSLTPLLAATTIWLLARSVSRREGWTLALAGLFAGVTLQSHPTVAPMLLGAVACAVVTRRESLRTRWPYLAVGLALLGYGVLLAHHVQSRFEVVQDIQSKQARYLDADDDAGESSDRGVYGNNLEQILVSTARLTAGHLEEQESTAHYVHDPWVLTYAALALIGVGLAARSGQPLLLAALLCAIFLPPLFSGKYKPVLDGRYLMPLIPILFVGIGGALAATARFGERVIASWIGARLSSLAVAVCALTLIVYPMAGLAEFYEETQEDGFSNELYMRTLATVRGAANDESVWLDPRLNQIKSAGGGNAIRNLRWMLAVSGVQSAEWGGDQSELAGRVAILHRATADRLDDHVTLTPLDGRRLNGRDRPSYRAYRIGVPT